MAANSVELKAGSTAAWKVETKVDVMAEKSGDSMADLMVDKMA